MYILKKNKNKMTSNLLFLQYNCTSALKMKYIAPLGRYNKNVYPTLSHTHILHDIFCYQRSTYKNSLFITARRHVTFFSPKCCFYNLNSSLHRGAAFYFCAR